MVVLSLASCADKPPPSVLLITLDTTRADRLGCYGYDKQTSPNVDRFADRAILYEFAYAASSWTLPSHASLFTGLLAREHGALSASGPNRRPLAESFTTLAELLSAAGYETAAIVSGPALRREFGVAQGFARYDDDFNRFERMHGKRAAVVADRAIEYIDGFGSRPYFLFLNFFDPHAPYWPPAPFNEGLQQATALSKISGDFVERLEAGEKARSVDGLDASERIALDAARAGYDAEIRYMDHHVGRVLAAVEDGERARETLVVITGDHGESFGEHYLLSHGAHLYEDNVRVPLIVRYPGSPRVGSRIDTPVQNHRVFATVLSMIGLPLPDGVRTEGLDENDGTILTEVQRDPANVQIFGSFFDRDLRAIYDAPYKLIASSDGSLELFDLANDPEELKNLVETKPDTVRDLSERLRDVSARHPPMFEEEGDTALRPETEEALRALGYLQ